MVCRGRRRPELPAGVFGEPVKKRYPEVEIVCNDLGSAATPAQLAAAEGVGAGLAEMGLAVVCGGRAGVMEAVCQGAAARGGITVGLLPDADPGFANLHVGIVIATGIGEARNALITRASFCLVAIGDSFGTLSEVAFARQFGKLVIGLAGAARVAGVVHVDGVDAALERVARLTLAL